MKILEQILQEIEEISYPSEGIGCGLEDVGITDRYEAAAYGWNEAVEWIAEIIRSHTEDDGWIPVAGKNFPTSLEDKLLQTDSGNMYVGWYNENLEEFETEEFMFGRDYGKVIAWKPLPEPYRPKED